MTQKERRLFLIQSLLLEQQHDRDIEIPKEDEAQKNLLRSLFNIRMPNPVSKEFLAIQDAYLQEEIRRKGITEFADLQPIQNNIYLWRAISPPCAVTRS